MANRYVRIYNGPERSNIIGFSAGAIPERPSDLEEFLSDRGYETHKYDVYSDEPNPKDEEVIKALGGVSFYYLGVQPPLKDQHIGELAQWCVKNVDPYHNSGLLIDDRETPSPIQPFGYRQDDVIAEW